MQNSRIENFEIFCDPCFLLHKNIDFLHLLKYSSVRNDPIFMPPVKKLQFSLNSWEGR